MSGGSAEDVPELVDYAKLLRRRALPVVLGILLGLATAVLYVTTATKTYQASADVLVRPVDALSSTSTNRGRNAAAAINVDTEAQVVTSQSVAGKAAEKLGGGVTSTELVHDIDVTVPPNSTVLSISAKALSADAAAARAQAFATGYLDLRLIAAQAATAKQVSSLRDQASALSGELTSVEQQLARLPRASTERSVALTRQNQLQNQLTTINNQITQVEGIPLDPGTVLRPATAPSSPASPVVPVCLLGGALVGLLLGIAAALVLDRRDTRLRDDEDFAAAAEVPVLGRIPAAHSPRLPVLVDPNSPIGDAYRQLRASLIAARKAGADASPDHRPGVLVLAPAAPGIDAGPALLNVAASLRRASLSVAVLSAHMRGSTLQELLSLPSGRGLGELLRSEQPIRDVVQYSAALPEAPVIVARTGDEAIDLLQSDRMGELVHGLRERFDVVLIEAAPVGQGSDARDITQLSDGLVLVAHPGQTQRQQIRAALAHLGQVLAPVLGLVLVESPQARGRTAGAVPSLRNRSDAPELSSAES